jgi:predicted AlkP superfamily pyrophosphatase or phosphodiesterase
MKPILTFTLVFISLLIKPACAQAPKTTATRLVLLIVVDQFRYDYLERFDQLFVSNGLKRLQREGSSWVNANFDHIPTYTAPGHATLMTGTWPANNGIIGNKWFDKENGKDVESVKDETVKGLGDENQSGSSPKHLMAGTLGDELRIKTGGKSKVIGISIKDRAAILTAGRNASAAYWYSEDAGRMISSSYYFDQLPSWVQAFNQKRIADKHFGAGWERLIPEAEYLKLAGIDNPTWELSGPNAGAVTFPYIITGQATSPNPAYYKSLARSPFSNELLLQFTKETIEQEHIGMDQYTDLICLSLSANDYIGHNYGPYSHEVMDITLRTDRQVENLLTWVDQKIGLNNTLIIFTSDHGVAPYPEQAKDMRLSAGRINNDELLSSIRKAISENFSIKENSPTDYIKSFRNENIYFDPVALKRDAIDRQKIELVAGETAMKFPGVVRYFTRTQLESGCFSDTDAIARRVHHGFYSSRSGDVVFVYDPFKFSATSDGSTTHGSGYTYDTHVPLVIMGHGVKAGGRYFNSATPADIAPTLAALMQVNPPSNSTGRILIEGFK